MKVILATGIYPPDIGGPATYVRNLARQLTERGVQVTVLTYQRGDHEVQDEGWPVVRVEGSGGSLLRWRRYAKTLRKIGSDADVMYCFSSFSAGVPLWMARIKGPKKILRLGGDFAWERYTDLGGRKTLRQFLSSALRMRIPVGRVLQWFNHVVFSTRFQQELYESVYKKMPAHSVIQNALPESATIKHERHDPLQLLYLGRFVRFKNLENLIRAVAKVPLATLTLVGEGPVRPALSDLARQLQLQGRVSVIPVVHGEGIQRVFAAHDLLILPSITEISPHVALEARAAGLPVLLSSENGLSEELRQGMVVRPMRTVDEITKAILEADHHYEELAGLASSPFSSKRGWSDVADETTALFQNLR